MRSASSGVSDANSRASTTSTGVGMGLPVLAFDHDFPEELALLRLDLPEAHELEHGQERDDDLRALALAARERREQQRPRVAEQHQDLSHPLEDRGRVRLDLAGLPPELLLDQPAHGALEEVNREVLERHILGQRQGARRPPPHERLLGLALGEPGAERLHARILAEALLQLEAQRLALL